MFSNSTQRKYWMNDSIESIEKLRIEANKNAGSAILKANKCSPEYILTRDEENQLIRSYLVNLREFCRKFSPPMPKSVIATAFIYVKRFYLNESCMTYSPMSICITCGYLACKVDEFNLSIDQFVKNVKGDCRKAQKTVLSNELLLMKKLRFHLTVHLPYRAVEGFLIDIRARFPPAEDKTGLLAAAIDNFLEKTMFTDACFLYTPSQIALAAIYHSAQENSVDLKPYLSQYVFSDEPEALQYFESVLRSIRKLIERDIASAPTKDSVKKIEKKLNELLKNSD